RDSASRPSRARGRPRPSARAATEGLPPVPKRGSSGGTIPAGAARERNSRNVTGAKPVIELPFDPNVHIGPITLAWHGIFTAVGIFFGAALALRLIRDRVSEDDGYAVEIGRAHV